MPCGSVPVVVPEQALGPTADGVRIGHCPPQGGRQEADTPWRHPLGVLVLLLFVDLDPDLAALNPLGGFFLLRTGGAARGPLPTLASAYENQPSEVYGNPITFRVEKVASVLRTAEPRIAASLFQQGLAARLWTVSRGGVAAY